MKMGKRVNNNSLLILYEGETEGEFYKRVLNERVPGRVIRRNYSNLKGVYNITKKVNSRIETYLSVKSPESYKCIHVFIAYDRDGPRETETLLDIDYLQEKYIYPGSRISSINEIIATQDLESWFFTDLDGIYKFLKVPRKKRNLKLYPNYEATNNRILSDLFHRYNSHYQKGRKANGFIDSLDLEKIISNVAELNSALVHIIKLC